MSDWLTTIDNLYENKIKEKGNNLYIFSEKIFIPIWNENNLYIQKKGIFSKEIRVYNRLSLLIEGEGRRRVYLSDGEIIDILIESKNVDTFLSLMDEILSKSKEMVFELDKNKQSILVPDSFNFQFQEKNIYIKGDFYISLNTILVLVFFIISKERTYSGKESEKEQIYLFKNLLIFYKSGKLKKELKDLNYKIDKPASIALNEFNFDERKEFKKNMLDEEFIKKI